MPSAGLQIFGAGLRLQPTTPGVSDQGNANITGKLITKNGIEPVMPTPWALTPTLGASAIYVGTAPTYNGGGNGNNSGWGNLHFGRNQTVQMNPNGNPDGNRIMIGDSQTTYGGYGVTIGYQATNGKSAGWPNAYAASIVIGWGAQARIQDNSGADASTVVGRGAGDIIDCNVGSVCIGFQATSNNVGGKNIVLGRKYQVTGTNSILIADGGAGSTLATDNTIQLGDATHTKILIGGADLSNLAGSKTRQVLDANTNATNQDGTIQYSTLTASRVVNLPLANTCPAGFRLMVADFSGAAAAGVTITLTRAGADTINAGTTSAIATAYGCREVMSDGVSKWVIVRSF